MAVRLQITNQAGTTRFVSPINITLEQEDQQPASLTCTFVDDLDVYETEDLDNNPENPIQLNASVIFTRDSDQEIEGNITFKNISKIGNGIWQITITALDRLYQGKNTRASQSGLDVWEISSPTIELTEERFGPFPALPREPFNDPLNRFYPSTAQLGLPSYIDLGEYNASTFSTTKYSSARVTLETVTDFGGVSDTVTNNLPNPGETTLNIENNNQIFTYGVGENVVFFYTDGHTKYYFPLEVISVTDIGGGRLELVVIDPESSLFKPTTGITGTVDGTRIYLGTSDPGFLPAGICITIGGGDSFAKLIYYDGLYADSSGEYFLDNVRFDSSVDSLPVMDEILPVVVFDATKVASTVELTANNTQGLINTHEWLTAVGRTIEFFNSSVSQGTGTIASASYDEPTDTITITIDEALPASIDEARIDNLIVNLFPQRIAPGKFILEANTTEGWAEVNPDTFVISYSEGIFYSTLHNNILGAAYNNSGVWKAATAWRVSYSIYDEEATGPDPLTISDAIVTVVSEDIETGGWGLTAGEVEVNNLDLNISKAYSDEPQLTFEWIDDFFFDLGFLQNEDVIGYFWDSVNSKFTVKAIIQEAVPDSTYKRVLSTNRDLVLDEVSSGIIVNYELPAVINFAGNNLWGHSDTSFPTSEPELEPFAFLRQNNEGQNGDGYDRFIWATPTSRDSIYSQNIFGVMTRLTDGTSNTAYGLEYGDNVGSNAPDSDSGPVFIVWFEETSGLLDGGTCNDKTIDNIRVILDIRKWANFGLYGENAIDIEVFGYTSCVAPILPTTAPWVGVPPVVSGEVELPGLKYLFQVSENINVGGTLEVVIEGSGLKTVLQAIGIRFKGAPTDKADSPDRNVQCKIKEISVSESPIRSEFVRITDDEFSTSSEKVYAPKTYLKLVNPTHKSIEYDINTPVSRPVAISIGRNILIQKLILQDSRVYSLQINGETLPKLLSTVKISSSDTNVDFTGVLLSKMYTLSNGVETLEVVLKDFSAGLFI